MIEENEKILEGRFQSENSVRELAPWQRQLLLKGFKVSRYLFKDLSLEDKEWIRRQEILNKRKLVSNERTKVA